MDALKLADRTPQAYIVYTFKHSKLFSSERTARDEYVGVIAALVFLFHIMNV